MLSTGVAPGHPPPRSGVFISYGHVDRPAAERLDNLLAQREVPVWYDARIERGADWRDAIVQHLERAQVMVILISAAAMQSKELKKELAVAAQEGVPMLTVRLERVKPKAAFAYELARGNWFDAIDGQESRLQELADLLVELVRHPERIDTTLQVSRLAREERARRDRWGFWAFLRRPEVMVMLVGLMSMFVFVLYDQQTSAIENRVRVDGVSRPLAFLQIGLVATFFTPLLVLQASQRLMHDFSVGTMLLIVAGVVNIGSFWAFALASVREARLILRERELRRDA